MKIWKGKLPNRPAERFARRELYEVEQQRQGRTDGSQDMIGLVYPGVNRWITTSKFMRRIPAHIESCNSAKVARWLSKVLSL